MYVRRCVEPQWNQEICRLPDVDDETWAEVRAYVEGNPAAWPIAVLVEWKVGEGRQASLSKKPDVRTPRNRSRASPRTLMR